MNSEEECQELAKRMAREEVKKAIIQMLKREEHNPIDQWTDKCIRVNHKTYMPVEVNKDRTLMPTTKLEISFRAEIRTPHESDDE